MKIIALPRQHGRCTELIFATYESSRRRGRVDLPLQVEDSPLLSMLDEGVIGPR